MESFRAECGEYPESSEHIDACESALNKFADVTAAVVGSLAVQKAIDTRDGPLEYGLGYQLEKLNGGLDEGITIDQRFPERASAKIETLTKQRDQLAEFLEVFESECGHYS